MGMALPVAAWVRLVGLILTCGLPARVHAQTDEALQGTCLALQSSLSQNVSSSIQKVLAAGVANPVPYEALTDMLAQLLSSCTQKPRVAVKPVRLLYGAEAAPLLKPAASAIEQLTGFKATLTFLPYINIHSEIMVQLNNRISMTDLWSFDSSGVVDMAESSGGFGFVDLKPFIDSDDGVLQWQDVHPFFREVASIYNGTYTAIPTAAVLNYLYYRKDIFQRYNLSVPVTWDEYLSVARRLNGTDFDGDGKPDHAICLERLVSGNKLLIFLASVGPSYLQTGGYSQGFLWDSATMQLLVNTPAMAEAMTVFMDIMKLAAPNPIGFQDGALPYLADFSRCAMGIHSAELFKSIWRWPKLKGKLGITLLPGSTRVLDRTTMQVVPCRPELCSDTAVDAQGNTISANRAMSSGTTTYSLAMNPYSPPDLRPAVWKVMTCLLSPDFLAKLYVYNPLVPYGPIRSSHMSTSPENLAAWVKAGYNLDDAKEFLTATQAILLHPNRVADLSVRNTRAFVLAFWDEARSLFMGDQTVQTTLSNVEQKFKSLVNANGGLEAFAAGYRANVKWVMPRRPLDEAATQGLGSSGLAAAVLVPAIVAPVIVLALLGMVAAVLVQQVKKAHEQHRSLLSRAVIPPKPGPRTTLLVTDVEGSTALFEAIPQAMDIALGVHNNIMTAVLDKHSGYPSASEGDGWVVAFHTPDAALSAAAALQEALLHADWPAELLQQACCIPTWVTVAAAGPMQPAAWVALVKALKQKGGSVAGIHAVLTASTIHQTEQLTVASRHPSSTADKAFQSGMSDVKPQMWNSLGVSIPSVQHEALICTTPSPTCGGNGGGGGVMADTWPLAQLSSTQSHSTSDAATRITHGPQLGCSLREVWQEMFIQHGPAKAAPAVRQTTSMMMVEQTGHSIASLASLNWLVSTQQGSQLDCGPSGALEPGYGDAQQADPEQLARLRTANSEAVDRILQQQRPKHLHSLPVILRTLISGGDKTNSTLGKALLEKRAGVSELGSILVYRGLKVRMGVHSGLQQAGDVVINKTTGRHQYGGAFLAAAKSVGDAAHGGMILASQEAFQQAAWSSLSTHMAVLGAGEHVLKASSDLPSTTRVLYEVIPHAVALRVAIAPPQLRSVRCKQPGYLVAPCGTVAVGYFQAVGIPALMSWDPEVTHKSLKLMHSVATSLLPPFGGYLVDLSEALGILAAFSSSADAIRWALVVQRALMHAEWPAELVEHPLGEELSITTVLPSPQSVLYKNAAKHASAQAGASHPAAGSGTAGNPKPISHVRTASQRVKFQPERLLETEERPSVFSQVGHGHGSDTVRVMLLRGLRTKCGIDVGEVRSTVNDLSGRITYVGKVMNRAARVTQATKSGQVWCSSAAWDATVFLHGNDGVTSRAVSSVPRLESTSSTRSEASPAHKQADVNDSTFPEPCITREDTHPVSVVLNAEQQTTGHGTFGTRTENLPEAAVRPVKRSSSTTGSAPGDDDTAEDVAHALDMLTDLARIGVNATSLGPQKLKSLQEMITLVKCELDQTGVALMETRS